MERAANTCRTIRRSRLRDPERDLVLVAPEPLLARLERAHDRVAGRVVVRGHVLVGRGVAAPDGPALRAAPQVHPGGADRHALRAAVHPLAAFGMVDRLEMGAGG